MKIIQRVFIRIIVVLVTLISAPAIACTVEEIVEMVSDGSGYKAVREVCEREVDGAPRCSLKEVVQFAQSGKDEYEIEERCGLCETPICETRMGTCVITGGVGRFREGGPCGCPSPMGYVPGIAACDN